MRCKWCNGGALTRVAWVPSREERAQYSGTPKGSIARLGMSEISGVSWTVERCAECGHVEWFLDKP